MSIDNKLPEGLDEFDVIIAGGTYSPMTVFVLEN